MGEASKVDLDEENDQIVKLLGNFGKWQLILILPIAFFGIMSSWEVLVRIGSKIIVIVSNASQSVSITFVNSLKASVHKPKMKSLVYTKRSQAESWWFLITKIYISCDTD